MSVTAAAIEETADSLLKLSGNRNAFQVIQGPIHLDATYDAFYAVGVMEPYAGRAMWVRTTAGDQVALQTIAISDALKAGPCDTNALDN